MPELRAQALTEPMHPSESPVAPSGEFLSQPRFAPGGAASIAFHVRHIAGATDRLLTYARGETLDDAQKAKIRQVADEVKARIDAEPKTKKWEKRAKKGTKKIWYNTGFSDW